MLKGALRELGSFPQGRFLAIRRSFRLPSPGWAKFWEFTRAIREKMYVDGEERLVLCRSARGIRMRYDSVSEFHLKVVALPFSVHEYTSEL